MHTGTAFTYAISTIAGYPAPAISTASPLPGGVTVHDNGNGTAALEGTPTPGVGGVFPVTLVATNGIGAPVDQSFTLTVYDVPTVSLPATDTITGGQAMTPVTFNYTGYPAPLLKAKNLPKGITLVNNNNGTATISGTPVFKVNGVFSASVTAASKAGTAPAAGIVFTVDSPPYFTSKAGAKATVGTPFTYSVTTAYGYPVAAITSSPLPAGLTLTDHGNGTATIAGTPSAAGISAVTLTATNGVGAPVNQTFTLTIKA